MTKHALDLKSGQIDFLPDFFHKAAEMFTTDSMSAEERKVS